MGLKYKLTVFDVDFMIFYLGLGLDFIFVKISCLVKTINPKKVYKCLNSTSFFFLHTAFTNADNNAPEGWVYLNCTALQPFVSVIFHRFDGCVSIGFSMRPGSINDPRLFSAERKLLPNTNITLASFKKNCRLAIAFKTGQCNKLWYVYI